ncbi:PP2C family protein-serine/threonine phosphatase [Pseudarthrobacter sp. NamE5]|uniref:PP2C family protein-serine/threonine phosphatase n=1 Tax=Pseudarthrobacter sp. NamE5 TaxID=2576839 RepID=UPI001F0EB399|nr:SpoIIE family protein phosphatase [Pseudarthrobacter sp. NamE5]
MTYSSPHLAQTSDTGTIRYSNAGYGLAHHLTAEGKMNQLSPSGPPLGIVSGQHWATEELHLEPGDSLITPSDGVLEVAHDNLAELQTELTAIAAAVNPIAAIKALINGLSQATADLTLLMVRRFPQKGDPLG